MHCEFRELKSFFGELEKIALYTDPRTGFTVHPMGPNIQSNPEGLKAWNAYQNKSEVLPTSVNPLLSNTPHPELLKRQRLMSKNIGSLPLIGAVGEYYNEGLPKHLQTGKERNLSSQEMAPIREAAQQASNSRTATINKRLHATGQTYKAPIGLNEQIAELPTMHKLEIPISGVANTVVKVPTKSGIGARTVAAAPKALKALKELISTRLLHR